jgi:hypothetical protein
VDTDAEGRHRRLEVLATVLLAVAALATAWSTFQSGRWRGEQASETSKATAAHIESSEAHTRAGQLTQIDVATFVQWVNAQTGGERELAAFYRRRFRKEFQPAFVAWLATDPFTSRSAPTSPFVMPQYRLAQTEEARRLAATAVARSASAGDANERADNYLLAVVLFATCLFFAGISTKVRSTRQREIVLGVGCVIFLGTLVWVAASPVSFSV